MLAVGKLMVKLLVVVEMLKILPAVPVETLAMMLLMFKLEEAKFLLPSVMTKLLGVKVAMLTLPKAVTWKMEVELLEATLKGFRVPVPWTLRDTAAEVALTPATVPLSRRAPVESVEALVHLDT